MKKKRLFPFIKDKLLVQHVLQYFADFLLLPYSMDLDMNDHAVLPPSSLSKSAYLRLKTQPLMTKEQIEQGKLGILNFLSQGIIPEKDIILLLIIATSDNKHNVSEKGENIIKRVAGVELWENTEVMNKLLKIYQGTNTKPGNIVVVTHSNDVRLPSSKRLKMKIFPYILKSKKVVDLNPPLCLQIIFEGLFGDDVIMKIKHYSLEFIHHACQYCSDKTMTFMGPLLYQALCRVALDAKEDKKLRSLAFSGFSKLSRRCPNSFKKDIGLVQKLFAILMEAEPDISLAVQDSLSSMSIAYSGLTGSNAIIMESLILRSVENEIPSVRLAAVQFANAVFPSTHITSRYACLLCVADRKDDIREEALRGLKKSKSRKDTSSGKFYPDYSDTCDYLYTKILEKKSKFNNGELVFPIQIYEKMILFLKDCLYAHCGINEQDLLDGSYLKKLSYSISQFFQDELESTEMFNSPIGRHILLIKEVLIPTAGYSLHAIALKGLLELMASNLEKISWMFTNSTEWLQAFLYSPKEEVRESTARLLSIIICNQSTEKISQHLDTHIKNCSSKLFEEHHGNILAVAYILSRYLSIQRQIQCTEMETNHSSATNEKLQSHMKSFVELLCPKIKDNNILISNACCVAISEISRQGVLPLPDSVEGKDVASKELIVKELSSLLKTAPENKVKEKAAVALGNICVGDPGCAYRDMIIDSLIATAKVKISQPELHFTIGEAFSCIGAGRLSKLSKDKWILEEKEFVVVSTDNYMSRLLQRIIKECVYGPISMVRQAGVIWLLCIVKYAAEHPVLQADINIVQTAFIDMLSDSDDITQDVASRGLSLVYDLVKVENKDELVSILIDRLMSGKRHKQTVNADTELFKPGALGSTPDGGNISTYKELCSLATSMNRPDLMYKFMNLANHNAMWNSRKGAAFGFLSIASLAGDQLKPYLSEIIPKLYRYQYDPNPGVQKAMSNIWSALVPEGKKTLDKYTKQILEDILLNITSNIWRTRESCCLALNDLIRAASVDDFIDQLPSLWEVVFRVMDDIKESVRKSATTLAKTLSRISVRICDVNQSKLGQRAVSEVLPVLLETGLSSRVAEVKQLSLQTLVQVTTNAGALLKPHIPKFITALLESLSGLEPQYLNTLSLQLSQSKEAQDKLDVIRISASKSSPMMEAVNFCVQHVDDTVLPELIPRICDLLKTGLGIGTKVGCSNMIIQLTLQCRAQLTPYAGKLLGALLNGLSDRNNAIKKAYANTIGHLVRYAKDSSIEKLLNKLTKVYFEKEDESIHYSCALCINAMSKYSPDTFYNYGSMAMPLVFIAMQSEIDNNKQSETSVHDLWEEIWNNNTSGNSSAMKLYLSEIYTFIEPLFSNQSWTLREKAGKSVMSIAETLGASLQQPHLGQFINLLLRGLQGRTWTGKESLLKALSKIYVKCREMIMKILDDSIPTIGTVIDTLLRECKKENVNYKLCAVECTTLVIEEWKVVKFDEFKPIIESLLDQKNEDDEDDEMDHSSKSIKENMCSCAYATLGRVWPYDTQAQELHFHYMSKFFTTRLEKSTWKNQLSLLKAATSFVSRTHWQKACTWYGTDGINYSEDLVNIFVKQVCTCAETSSYSSIKLNCIKLLKELFIKASDCQPLMSHLQTFRDRIVLLTKQLSSSTNFDITNNVIELSKVLSSSEMEM